MFLSSSEIHLAHQLRRGADEVVEMARVAVARARSHTADVEFSCMDATRSDPEFVARLVRVAIARGRDHDQPARHRRVCAARPGRPRCSASVYARVPELASVVVESSTARTIWAWRPANSLAAIAAGARQVELAVNGLGERAGNTPFEEVVMALRVHGAALGVETGVDTRGIYAVSQAVARHSGIAVPPNKAIVGRNAFRHASGIHQDGVLKHRETYEAIDPAEIGHPIGTEIVLGKLSGRAGFASRVRALGPVPDGAALERAFARFQALADERGEVDDDERSRSVVEPTARLRGRARLMRRRVTGDSAGVASASRILGSRSARCCATRGTRRSSLAGSEALIVEWVVRASTGGSLGLALGAALACGARAHERRRRSRVLPGFARAHVERLSPRPSVAGREPRGADQRTAARARVRGLRAARLAARAALGETLLLASGGAAIGRARLRLDVLGLARRPAPRRGGTARSAAARSARRARRSARRADLRPAHRHAAARAAAAPS